MPGTVGDLSLALKGAGYAAKAAKLANLAQSIYSAANAGASAAAGGIAPLTGLGAVVTLPAMAMMAAGLIRSAATKNAQKTTQGRVKQMQEVQGIGQSLGPGILGAKSIDELRKYLDTEQYGSRTGDLLHDLVKKNLTGYYMAGEATKGGAQWAPNESLQSLASALESMGYTKPPAKDPTGLLMSGGGFLDTKHTRTAMQRDVGAGMQNWNAMLEKLSSRFPKASYAGTVPRQQVSDYYSNTMFPDVRSMAMYLQGDPTKQLGPGGANQFVPEIRQKKGYTDEAIAKSWSDWQREIEAMNIGVNGA